MVIPDDTGCWKGMAEKIERAVYDGLTKADQDKIEAVAAAEADIPAVFESAEAAWNWGVEQGAFTDVDSSSAAYNDVKKEQKPKSAQEMASYWIARVMQLAKEGSANGQVNGVPVEPPPVVEDEVPF